MVLARVTTRRTLLNRLVVDSVSTDRAFVLIVRFNTC